MSEFAGFKKIYMFIWEAAIFFSFFNEKNTLAFLHRCIRDEQHFRFILNALSMDEWSILWDSLQTRDERNIGFIFKSSSTVQIFKYIPLLTRDERHIGFILTRHYSYICMYFSQVHNIIIYIISYIIKSQLDTLHYGCICFIWIVKN